MRGIILAAIRKLHLLRVRESRMAQQLSVGSTLLPLQREKMPWEEETEKTMAAGSDVLFPIYVPFLRSHPHVLRISAHVSLHQTIIPTRFFLLRSAKSQTVVNHRSRQLSDGRQHFARHTSRCNVQLWLAHSSPTLRGCNMSCRMTCLVICICRSP